MPPSNGTDNPDGQKEQVAPKDAAPTPPQPQSRDTTKDAAPVAPADELAPDADEPGDDLPDELKDLVTDHDQSDIVPDNVDIIG